MYFILAFVTVATFTSHLIKQHLIKQKADDLYREAIEISASYAGKMYTGALTSEAARRELVAVGTYIDSIIWIVDTDGTIILNTRNADAGAKKEVLEDFDPSHNSRNYMQGDFYGYFNEEMISVCVPVNTGFKVRGYLVIHAPMSKIMEEHENHLRIAYLTMIVLVLISLLILLVFTVIVYWPLRKITKATEEYARGNYNYELKVNSQDEMGYLAGTLSYMAMEIASAEDAQKKFVANISHDFRSPLTSIRGYLEAMIDGTIPQELYEKYLGIVINETERLTKLTSSLLQLNNLNVKGVVLDIKDFDINETMKRSCETFEGKCMDKRITLNLVLTGDSMLVHADESKIQQVIYNLLDNAIKFSHEDSEIKIETTVRGDKLFVSVKDSGIGIPKESVNKVFDRFYKSDLSRGKDKKGTGLGLAITREIIKAHDEIIDVISTEGVGTEFIFTLAIAR